MNYPHITPRCFWHLEWVVKLIEGHVVCDLGAACGDAMIEMSQHAERVVGMEVCPDRVRVARSRGLDVVVGDWLSGIPEADVYCSWPYNPKNVKAIVDHGADPFIFQCPDAWSREAELWHVQPDAYKVMPVIRDEGLKEFGARLGGTLEFHAWYFVEPMSERPDDFPSCGWRQAMVFRRK